MRLALGTAQFGMDYNIIGSKMIPLKEISLILDYSRKIGINTIDTAIGYGTAEKKLGEVGVKDFNIYTKLPKINLKYKEQKVSKFIYKEIEKSLNNLQVDFLSGIFLHNPSDIFSSYGEEIIETFNDLKTRKVIKDFGYSIYETNEIRKLNRIYNSDIFQLPYNIFDRRIEFSDEVNELKKKNIKIFSRSTFLQGILLQENPEKVNQYFMKWLPLFNEWKKWLKNNNSDPLAICLNYIKKNNKIDKIIVGIDNLEQLILINEAYKNEINLYPKHCYSYDINLIDPRRWSS